jgi:FlaG/FlaF family flagellin (archaellin)
MRPYRNTADAVSPVVGIMLMMAVTVMLAAIVSSYAGGFSEGAGKTPQSTIRASPDLGMHRINFDHDGGDAFAISAINIILRAGDNQTTLSSTDAGSSKLRFFKEVGSTGPADTAIKAGDTFFIEGEDAGSGTGMQFGSMVLMNNTKITWIVVDRTTSKSISMGEFYL